MMRACRLCGVEQDMADFLIRRKTGEVQKSRVCRSCWSARNRANRRPDANDPPLPTDTHQRCQACGEALYRVDDWEAERSRNTQVRRWFCGDACRRSIMAGALDNLFPRERPGW